ncbi:6-phosphogluconolactonase [Pontivivens insulae]|uniref:6-phosphogluconolactonase n=1 Tax=Pontivivens insulae TaxID=1639689 RepID=A0A2R8A6H7_9RHOB|nr:6-phosphogluconolactonase [Pontivivens insulae]RED17940.1 6-phosphogluconolactonase [Pontivivens insulae]SPF27829.1 6-phosphogluconolactonase [Pontivivens insulae]
MIRYDDRAALMTNLAEVVAGELRTALHQQAHATLAVPGGTTPGPFLTALSDADLDWSRVRVMLTDERFVPESSDRSNTRLLRGTLLQNRAAAATLVPFYREADAPEDVLDALGQSIGAALPLDVCVLGMGADMHTASIFPGADRLAEALSPDAPPLLPMRAPGAPEPRLTLTAPVLAAARHIHVLIQGQDKADALAQAQAEDDRAVAPIRVALDAGATVHWAA